MAYNNYYNQPQPLQMLPQNNINWVSGLEGAKQYPLNRNGAVVLLDNDQNKFYIKTCDNIGMCDVRVFEFTEITNSSKGSNIIGTPNEYVTRAEFDNLINQLGGLTNESVSANNNTTK